MKRIVFIGKNKYGKKICAFLIGAFVFYVIFFSFKIVTFNDIGQYFNKSAGELVYMLALKEMKNSYTTISYKSFNLDKITMAEAVIENVNSSISYYGYVKDNVKQNYLVVYDPNKIEDETDVKYLKEEQESTVEAEVNTVEPEKNSDVPVSVVGNGIMKLSGTGTGTIYSLDQLQDFNFMLSSLYVVPARSSVLSSDLDPSVLLGMDMSIKKDSSVPQILIYHTHSMEGFSDSIEANFDTNIVSVGTYLAKLLSEGYGYNVIHCTQSFDYVDGKFDRSKAYTYARPALEQILADNPSIEVVLDVHRDGVDESLHLVTDVNGKQTSQIMFFNGMSRTKSGGEIDYLYNKYRSQNLAFSLQMKLLAEEYFPGFTRKNYLDAYQYNLDLRERSVLVEVGAQTNSLQEAKNAMEPLAAILDRVLSGDGGI